MKKENEQLNSENKQILDDHLVSFFNTLLIIDKDLELSKKEKNDIVKKPNCDD